MKCNPWTQQTVLAAWDKTAALWSTAHCTGQTGVRWRQSWDRHLFIHYLSWKG